MPKEPAMTSYTLPASPDGYVVLPKAEYDAMRDALDIAEARAVSDRIKAGEETFPAEIVDALIDGENPVRVFRNWRKMTQEELAGRAGLSRPYIAEIETDKKEGTVRTLSAICRTLEIDLDDLAGWLIRDAA